jgi:hypothetical protein
LVITCCQLNAIVCISAPPTTPLPAATHIKVCIENKVDVMKFNVQAWRKWHSPVFIAQSSSTAMSFTKRPPYAITPSVVLKPA